jgi:hypothetical protein
MTMNTITQVNQDIVKDFLVHIFFAFLNKIHIQTDSTFFNDTKFKMIYVTFCKINHPEMGVTEINLAKAKSIDFVSCRVTVAGFLLGYRETVGKIMPFFLTEHVKQCQGGGRLADCSYLYTTGTQLPKIDSKIHTSLRILKISRKTSAKQKSRDFCQIFVIPPPPKKKNPYPDGFQNS